MRQFFRSYGFYIFGLLAFADLGGIVVHHELLHHFTKPLLMPALFLTVLLGTNAGEGKTLLLAGLFFSFAGDVFLLFDRQYPICFILGLLSFLITHIFYILYFLRLPANGASLLRIRPYLILFVLMYVGGLLFLLIPHLGPLIIPVVLYALVLGSMLLAAMDAYYKAVKIPGRLFVAGALLFVLSDSLLAINKFYASIPAADFLTMLTYCAAQCCIVAGFVMKKEN